MIVTITAGRTCCSGLCRCQTCASDFLQCQAGASDFLRCQTCVSDFLRCQTCVSGLGRCQICVSVLSRGSSVWLGTPLGGSGDSTCCSIGPLHTRLKKRRNNLLQPIDESRQCWRHPLATEDRVKLRRLPQEIGNVEENSQPGRRQEYRICILCHRIAWQGQTK